MMSGGGQMRMPMGSSAMMMPPATMSVNPNASLMAGMEDNAILGDFSQRHAFVTHEVLNEGEGDVVPFSSRSMIVRYVKAHNFITYASGASTFAVALLASNFDDFRDASEFLKETPVLLAIVPGITLAFALAQIFKATGKNKPHYLMSGIMMIGLALAMVIFALLGLAPTGKFLALCAVILLWVLQYCQDWEFALTLDKFQKTIAAGHGRHHQRAREGDEEYNRPVLAGFLSLLELKWIFGCNTHKTREKMDMDAETNEMWGNFILKDRPEETTGQLVTAYRLASDSEFVDMRMSGQDDPRLTERSYEWLREPFSRTMMFLEGCTTNLVWMLSLGFAGAELGMLISGKATTADTPRMIAAVLAGVTLAAFAFNIFNVQKIMSRAVGVAVAEKEWMAIDVLEKIQDRKKFRARALNNQDKNRLNLTYLWLCVSAAADYFGAGLICKLSSNCALMTKVMLEVTTSYEFVGFEKSRWELMLMGNVINAVQACLLGIMAVLYFGAFGAEAERPVFWGTAVLLLSLMGILLRIREAARLWSKLEAHNPAERIIMTAFAGMFCLNLVVLLTCMLPIIVGNGALFGGCGVQVYSDLFPGLCKNIGATDTHSLVIVLCACGLGVGFVGGAFFLGDAPSIFK